ncbi:unnamed protein product [Sordaria macrospora k-hell]|uniref:WGS project CABT00000000 data, contig 2.82 n=1 Tax=Sordaria macrospora (strain ATCC MYA-333 / DSM 997 / K(L3346) / K-hell) TaxID=771870 RepID=F7WBR0_SORMK|nr:uncharacterized protein SMAC_08976 [Sordaria macrospora k-hell]CCC05475.1 unnamed protein product [Sordaria macrospora k-hell]
MRTSVFALAASLAALASAKEKAVDMRVKAELYDNGARHEHIMALKHQTWAELDAAGVYDSTQYKKFPSSKLDYVPCKKGYASYVANDPKYTFRCNNLDLYDFKTHAELGSGSGRGAGSWGWTSPKGREFVAIAQEDGTAFAEVTKKGKLVYLGRLPQYTTAAPSLWREIKGYKSYILIGSEAVNHGVQIFDLAKLQNVDPKNPKVFTNEEDLDGWWNEGLPVGRSHNVVTNEEKKYGVAVGFQPRTGPLKAGLVFFDLTDPKNPKTLGGSGEDGFDVTDKQSIRIISNTSYEGASYTHQGWVLDPNWQKYLILDDEYDEYNAAGLGADGYPITYIWDITSLENPKQTGHYKGLRRGIDHNQFVHNGFSYQSNYGLGLSILDLRSVPFDPTGKRIKEVAYFDVHPEDDDAPGGGNVTFTGTWSHYPFFPSGYIVINTMDRGAFVVKRTPASWWPF